MAFDLNTLIQGARASRQYFLKHIGNVRDDQWDWKPYAECKSIRETLAHLVSDDRAFIEILDKGDVKDYDALAVEARDVNKLLALLDESNAELCAFLLGKFSDTPLDTEVQFFTGKMPLGNAIAGISSEDYYHAGQVAFIRIATDPSWDYYAEIYG